MKHIKIIMGFESLMGNFKVGEKLVEFSPFFCLIGWDIWDGKRGRSKGGWRRSNRHWSSLSEILLAWSVAAPWTKPSPAWKPSRDRARAHLTTLNPSFPTYYLQFNWPCIRALQLWSRPTCRPVKLLLFSSSSFSSFFLTNFFDCFDGRDFRTRPVPV